MKKYVTLIQFWFFFRIQKTDKTTLFSLKAHHYCHMNLSWDHLVTQKYFPVLFSAHVDNHRSNRKL